MDTLEVTCCRFINNTAREAEQLKGKLTKAELDARCAEAHAHHHAFKEHEGADEEKGDDGAANEGKEATEEGDNKKEDDGSRKGRYNKPKVNHPYFDHLAHKMMYIASIVFFLAQYSFILFTSLIHPPLSYMMFLFCTNF